MPQYCFALCIMPHSGPGIWVRGKGERTPVLHIGNDTEGLGLSVSWVWSCDSIWITPNLLLKSFFLSSSFSFIPSFSLFLLSLSGPIQLWTITMEKIFYHQRHNYILNVRNKSLVQVSIENVSCIVISNTLSHPILKAKLFQRSVWLFIIYLFSHRSLVYAYMS